MTINHWCFSPYQVQCEKMEIFPPQYASILESEFIGMTAISSWLLPSPKGHPPIVVLYSWNFLDVRTFVWRMIVLSTMLARMKIETLIFHVANLLTMLAYKNILLNSSKRMWTLLEQSNTLELDWFGVIWIMKGEILFIFDIDSMLVLLDFFPRCDDLLGKRKLIYTWIWSYLTEWLLCWLLFCIIIIIFENRVQNKA